MPEWVAREWERHSFSRKSRRMTPASTSHEFTVIPRPTGTELDAFAETLTRIQNSLLSNGTDQFELVAFPPALSRNAFDAARASEGVLRQQQQSLSLRVIQHSIGAEAPVIRWFEDERWQLEESGGGVLRGRIVPEWVQLVFGFESSWQAFRRVVAGRPDNLGTPANGPLSLWTNIWSALPTSQRGIYQMMERAIQWKSNWMSLEGVFSESVSELMYPLLNTSSTGVERLSLLHDEIEQLSSQLMEYGWLHQRQLDFDDVGALSSSGSQGEILWRVSDKRLQEVDDINYAETVAGWLAERVTTSNIKIIAADLVPNLNTLDVDRFVQTLQALVLDAESGYSGLAMKRGGVLTSFADLVAELVIRTAADCLEPLTIELTQAVERVTGMIIPRMNANAKELKKFGQSLRLRFDKLSDILQERGNLLQVTYSTAAAWQSHVARRAKVVAIAGGNAKVTATHVETPIDEKPTAISSTTISENRIQPSSQAKVDHSLRRVATDEIARMRKSDSARYESLKTAFYSSLESSKQKVFLDLSERLTPDEYERYLQFSLVKFMVDNPASWKSARTSSVNPISSDVFSLGTLLS